MAQVERDPKSAAAFVDVLSRLADDADAIQDCLKDSHDQVWWRTLVTILKRQYESAQEDLAIGMNTPREEDLTRGFIRTLKLILSFDIVGKTLVENQKVEEMVNQRRRHRNGEREREPEF